TRGPVLDVEDLPANVRGYKPDRFAVTLLTEGDIMKMDEVQRQYVQRVLGLVGGNKSRAALLLGIDRRTLYRWLDRALTTESVPPAA
ncbi:MAG TPA: helix-turn-helix domain-containing protein, partial [Labilithrix sp.]